MSLLDAFRQESAKQRALRIPLDYAYQMHWVGKWKAYLAVVATLLSVGYCVWAGLSPQGAKQLNPGKIVGAHSAWEHDCQACHTPGVPLRGDADGVLFARGVLFGAAASDPHVGDQKCIYCHQGPVHHQLQLDNEVETCAACHRDHQGESADINRVDERQCTRCHGDIEHHRKKPTGTLAANPHAGEIVNVASFAAHPLFRSVEELAPGSKEVQKKVDPGNLRFSHQLHMLPGQAAADAKAELKKKPSDLLPGMQDRYTVKNGLVVLQCGDCHQAEVSAENGAAVPSSGAYMQPVVFEQHCQACHALKVAVKDQAGQTVEKQVPHGIQGNELRAAISALQDMTQSEPLSPKRPVDAAGNQKTERVIPGQPFFALKSNKEDGTSQTESFASAEDVLTALRGNTCTECHGPPAKLSADAPADHDILPTNVPTVWFKNARFDHAAHRAVSCKECHPGAYDEPKKLGADDKGNPPSLADHDRILIPGLDYCKQCHGPETGKARFDCAECHRYHDIDKLPTGLGAEGRGVLERKSTVDFLHPITPAKQPEKPKEGA